MIPALLLISQTTAPALSDGYFTVEEARQVVAFWQTPGIYEPTDLNPAKPYRAVPNPEAALWLYDYYKTRDPGVRIHPTSNPAPRNATHVAWDRWIEQASQSDFKRIQTWADSHNLIAQGHYGPPMPEPERTLKAPAELGGLVGTPPSFALLARPQNHRIQLDTFTVNLADSPQIRPLYPYLRHASGVAHPGVRPEPAQIAALAQEAGFDPALTKVFQAVSALEGGFDSVNTYDSGYVSVGFIQFASLSTGSGTLGRLLHEYKKASPAQFAEDFRKYGVDVAPTGHLVVLDPATGREYAGPEAAQKIIEDKRLTAVFQRAGRLSKPFRLQQLRLAKSIFDPRSRTVQVYFDGLPLPVRVDQIVRSEAGLATVIDRLVNTGSLRDLETAANSVVRDLQAKNPQELLQYEAETVRRLTYRTDFLAQSNLSKPSSSTLLARQQVRPSISGSLDGGYQPFPVMPGFNVELSPRELTAQTPPPTNPGTSSETLPVDPTEPRQRTAPPVKPDSKVGLPITATGS